MDIPLAKYNSISANNCGYGGTEEELIVNYIHPLFLKARSTAIQEENSNWSETTTGVFAENYWKSMQVKISTLESIGDWGNFDQDKSMNAIDSKWSFKCKCYPGGLIKNFKSRYFARGDQQLEGIYLFETYVPVLQLTTVRLMLILEVLLGLKSQQGNVTTALLHSDIPGNHKVYVEITRGFEHLSKNGRQKFCSNSFVKYYRKARGI